MRYELADEEWAAIKPMLPNKPRGVPRPSDAIAIRAHPGSLDS
jgi:transposase